MTEHLPSDAICKVIKQYDELKERRNAGTLVVCRELADYIHPRRNNILIDQMGRKQTNRIFKSSPLKSLSDLAASMHGALTNPVLRWFRIRLRNTDPSMDLNDDTAITQWLDECSERMYLAFQDSNFDSEIQETYMDLGAFGIGALYQEERELDEARFNGFRFLALQIGDYVISENADGRVNVLYREFILSHRAALDEWGTEKLSQKANDKFAQLPESDLKILHRVVPRKGGRPDAKISRDLPFASEYYELENKHQISDGGYHEFPYMIPRWGKSGKSPYGYGPGHNALPDVKTLNRNVELRLQALAKIVNPPMEVLDDSVIGSLRLTPGAENVVRQLQAIRPLEITKGLKDALVEEERLVADVNKLFYNDLLQLPDKTIITATEVERRVEQIQRVLGPTIGRLTSELLTPLIERSFGVMLRAGAFSPPPPQLIQAMKGKSAEIDIQYEGPLTRAQKASELLSFQRMYELISPIAQQRPEVLDNIDDDKVVRRIITLSGVPAAIERTLDEVKGVRDARQAAHEAEMQQQQLTSLATAAGKAAPMVKALQAQNGQSGLVAGMPGAQGQPEPVPTGGA